MKAALVVQSAGPMKGKQIPIGAATFTIGRDKSCTLEAASPALAPQHCALEIHGDELLLRDLDSATGTFVNNTRVTAEVALNDGDHLKVGPLLFRVRIELLPPPPKHVAEPVLAEVFLVVKIAGPMEGKKLLLGGPIFTIGRAPQCSLQAGSPTISDTHCAIEIRGDRVFVRDLESATGTYVRDLRIAYETELKNGDSLRIGPLIFQVAIKLSKKAAASSSNTATPSKASKPSDARGAALAAQKLLTKYLKARRE